MIELQKIWPGWEIEELIGQGAYGKVYRIRREELGMKYYAALKVIEIPSDESEVRSLMGMGMDGLSIRDYFEGTAKNIANEIQIMESLKSAANIVHVEEHYLEEHKDSIGWTILIRMELLESMRKYQQREGIPDLKETLKIGKDICRALTYCEDKHVIHRDIKPDNIFRTEFGDYKLGDFGIARQMENTKSAYSQKGTSGYMAPEVNRGEKYDNTVDIYSLGVMLYQMLNRLRLPFVPTDTNRITPQILEEAQWRRFSGEIPPAPVDAPPALAKIILKAISPDPSRRYRNARQFLDALEAYENGQAPIETPEPEQEVKTAPVHWNTPNANARPASGYTPAQSSAGPAFGSAAGSSSGPAFGSAAGSASGPAFGSAAGSSSEPAFGSAAGQASSASAGRGNTSQNAFSAQSNSGAGAFSQSAGTSASGKAATKAAASSTGQKGLSSEEFAKAAAKANAENAKPKKKSSFGRILLSAVIIAAVYFVFRGLGQQVGKSMAGSSSSSSKTTSQAESSSSEETADPETLESWDAFAKDAFSHTEAYLDGEGSFFKTESLESIGARMAALGFKFKDESGNFHDEVYIEDSGDGKSRWLSFGFPNNEMRFDIEDWKPSVSRYIYYSGNSGVLIIGTPEEPTEEMKELAYSIFGVPMEEGGLAAHINSYLESGMTEKSFKAVWQDNQGIYIDYSAPEENVSRVYLDDKKIKLSFSWTNDSDGYGTMDTQFVVDYDAFE